MTSLKTLISIRAKTKFKGLVNVSGFHVDPGFSGPLKFSVYNAGSQEIRLSRGEGRFLIWFSSLDSPTNDLYHGGVPVDNRISSEDETRLQGEIASPGSLKKQFEELKTSHDQRFAAIEKDVALWRGLTIGMITLIFGLAMFCFKVLFDKSSGIVSG